MRTKGEGGELGFESQSILEEVSVHLLRPLRLTCGAEGETGESRSVEVGCHLHCELKRATGMTTPDDDTKCETNTAHGSQSCLWAGLDSKPLGL